MFMYLELFICLFGIVFKGTHIYIYLIKNSYLLSAKLLTDQDLNVL